MVSGCGLATARTPHRMRISARFRMWDDCIAKSRSSLAREVATSTSLVILILGILSLSPRCSSWLCNSCAGVRGFDGSNVERALETGASAVSETPAELLGAGLSHVTD
jgi:hypothetical protein